jgi:glutamine amidotransferase
LGFPCEAGRCPGRVAAIARGEENEKKNRSQVRILRQDDRDPPHGKGRQYDHRDEYFRAYHVLHLPSLRGDTRWISLSNLRSGIRCLACVLIDPKDFGASREDVRLALEKENIESRPIWKPMHLQPVFKNCRAVGGAVSEEIFEKGLCLPSGTAMTESDLDHAMTSLAASGMLEPLRNMVFERKTPILGICVGMQILARTSEEGKLPGLGWIPGRVRRLDVSKLRHKPLLPHMGWNNMHKTREHGLLQGIEDNAAFYFLHSYRYVCDSDAYVLGSTEYGEEFPCVIASGNILGVQFHPEKSHANGIRLLRNFGEL